MYIKCILENSSYEKAITEDFTNLLHFLSLYFFSCITIIQRPIAFLSTFEFITAYLRLHTLFAQLNQTAVSSTILVIYLLLTASQQIAAHLLRQQGCGAQVFSACADTVHTSSFICVATFCVFFFLFSFLTATTPAPMAKRKGLSCKWRTANTSRIRANMPAVSAARSIHLDFRFWFSFCVYFYHFFPNSYWSVYIIAWQRSHCCCCSFQESWHCNVAVAAGGTALVV